MTQSTAVATLPAFTQNMMPTLPQEMRAMLAQAFAPAMDSFGSNFNRISLKGSRIHMIVGGQEVRLESNALDFVILGISTEQYCVWYKDKYKPGEDDGKAPDAIWAQNEPAPSNVPAAALLKDADGRNQYALRRRLVIAAFDTNKSTGEYFLDLETLFVFDVGGMSTFGDDLQIQGAGFGKAHSLSNYMQWMKNTGMYPCAMPTKIIFDTNQSVPVVRFIPAVNNQTGQVAVLPPDMFATVVAKAVEPSTLELLDWRRTNDTVAAPAAQPAPAQQPVMAQQVVQQAQPVVQQTVEQSQAFDAPQQQVVQQQQPVVQQQVQQTPVQQVVQQQPVVQQVQQQPVVQQTVAAQPDTTGLAQNMTAAVNTAVQQPVVQQQQPVVQQQAQQPVVQQAAAPVMADADLDSALAGLMSDAGF